MEICAFVPLSSTLVNTDIDYPLVTEDTEFPLMQKPPCCISNYLGPTPNKIRDLNIGFVVVK